mgnify:CR=1 FL=1
MEQRRSHKVAIELYDAETGDCLLAEEQQVEGLSSSFEAELKGVKLWSAEEPNLYRAVISVEDAEAICSKSSRRTSASVNSAWTARS